MSQLIKQSHASTGVPLWTPAGSGGGGNGFTAEFPDIWDGSPPTTIDDAVNRLSMLLYARTVTNGTLGEPTQQSTIMMETNNSGGADVFVVKYSQEGIPIWKARMGGTLADTPNSVATDSLGNIYITGQYASNPMTIFNADGSSFTTLVFQGFQNNGFVVKYNANGVGQWATRISGTNGAVVSSSIAVDSSGNVYVSGLSSSQFYTIFNSDGTTFSTLGPLSTTNFLVKYDTNGFGQWTTRLSVSAGTLPFVYVMPSGEVYLCGSYSANPLTILNSDGTTFGTLANAGESDYYLVKYNTSGFGQWATRVGGTGTEAGNPVIKVGTTGNVYITGIYNSNPLTIFNSDTTTFGTLANSGGNDIFIVKYNTSGIAQWGTRMAGTGNEGGGIQGIALDSVENVYVTARFLSFILTIFNADGSTFKTIETGSAEDGVLVKYSTDGVGQWSTQQKGFGRFVDLSVAVDSLGNPYQFGMNSSTNILYNADDSIFNIVSSESGSFDAVILKYNPNGFIQWYARQTGGGFEESRSIATHSTDVVIVGSYTSVPFFIRSAGL